MPSRERLRALARAVDSVVTALTTTMSPVVTGRDRDGSKVRFETVEVVGTVEAMAYSSATDGAVLSMTNEVVWPEAERVFPEVSVAVTVAVTVPSPAGMVKVPV